MESAMPASHELPPRAVVGTAALSALAVPARFAILDHLLAAGPRTATECAEVVGESPSNCSWHLRALAKVGLVERAPTDGDERRRPWRATAPGFTFAGDDGPAGRMAAAAVAAVAGRHADELYQRYVARQALLPERWRAAAGANAYSVTVTPAELQDLLDAVDALVRPYVRAIREDAPPDAAVVHVSVRAFLDPDRSHPDPESHPGLDAPDPGGRGTDA
jgi:DNA-binding transcriptional ArsR family regulator